MDEERVASGHQVILSSALFGLVMSIAAGGLFSYLAEDTTPAGYLLQLASLFLVETPFIALYAFLARRYGWQWFVPMAAVGLAASAAAFLPSFSWTPLVFLKIELMGLVIGRMNWFNQSFFERMTAAVMPGIALALVFGGLIIFQGVSPEETGQIRSDTIEVYTAFMAEDDATNAADNAMLFFQTLFAISVAFIAILSIIEVWAAFLLANWLFARLRDPREELPSFNGLKVPFHFIWLLLASAPFALFPVPAVSPFMINVLTVMGALYCFQGLAVATFLLNRYSRSPLPKVLFWVIFFITISVTGVVLILVGIADNWFNLRNVPEPGPEAR